MTPSDSTTANLYSVVSGVATNIGSFPVPVDTTQRGLRFSKSGSALKVRVWNASSPEPTTWNLQVTNTAVAAAGAMDLGWVRTAGFLSVHVDDVVYKDLTKPPTPAVTYGYDPDGNIKTETLPAGTRTWTRTQGRLTQLAQTVPGAVQTTDLTYDTTGRVRTEKVGTLTTTYDYDKASQLRTVTPSTGTPTSYVYNGRGRLAFLNTGGVITSYAHDDAGQLTSATAGTNVTNYTYDPAGRRLTETGPAGTTNFTYDPAGRLATHERAGTKQTRTYTHDDTLTAVASTTTTGTINTRNTLDWDTAGGINQLVNLNDTAATNIIGGNHTPAAMRRGATTTALAVNAQGSVITSTGTTTVARAATYDTYGTPTGTPTFQPRLGYRGELTFDNLTHLRARDYQPGTAAFTTVDPLEGVPGTTTLPNPYHYADNNPLNKTDPTGLQPGMSPFAGDPFGSGWLVGGLVGSGAARAAFPAAGAGVLTGGATATGAATFGWIPGVGWGIVLGGTLLATNPFNYQAPVREAGGALYDWFAGGGQAVGADLYDRATGQTTSPGTRSTPQLSPVPAPSREPEANGSCSSSSTGGRQVRLVYEHNPKHGQVQRWEGGREIARRPHGGQVQWQAILDSSYVNGPRHRRGTEPDTGLVVELRLHLEQDVGCETVRYYHGYVPGG